LIINVDGRRIARRTTFVAEEAPCALSVTISDDGAKLRADVSGGAPPYVHAWSAETDYCAGLAGYASGQAVKGPA
jgi:hypothetical protein